MTFISDKIAIRRCFLFLDHDSIQKHSSSYIGLVICQQMRYYLLPQAVKYHDSMSLLYRIKSKTKHKKSHKGGSTFENTVLQDKTVYEYTVAALSVFILHSIVFV